MAQTTTTFTLTVSQTTSSVLGSIAAQLKSEFPTTPAWSNQLSNSDYHQLAATHPDRPADATTINEWIDHYGGAGGGIYLRRAFTAAASGSFELLPGAGGCYSSHWDADRQMWWFVAGATGNSPWIQTIVQYSEARDEFKHWQGSAIGSTDGLWHPAGYPHNFGGSAIDLANARLWRMQAHPTYGHILAWASLADPTVRGMDTSKTFANSGSYQPLKLLPGLGAQGSLIYMRSRGLTPAAFQRYDIETGALTTSPNLWATYATPAAVEYEGAIYWSAARLPEERGFYRITAGSYPDRETLAVPPIVINANSSDDPNNPGNGQIVALNGKIYAFSNTDFTDLGAIYVYDIGTNQWSGPLSTPALPGYTTNPDPQTLCSFSITAVEAHGVILMAQNIDPPNNDAAFVWKP